MILCDKPKGIRKAKASKAKVGRAKASKAKASKARASRARASKAKASKAKASKTKASKAKASKAKASKAKASKVKASKANLRAPKIIFGVILSGKPTAEARGTSRGGLRNQPRRLKEPWPGGSSRNPTPHKKDQASKSLTS